MDTQLSAVWAAAVERERSAFISVVCIYSILISEGERKLVKYRSCSLNSMKPVSDGATCLPVEPRM